MGSVADLHAERRPAHPQMSQLIGDFTSVLLVDFDLGDPSSTLRGSIEQTQQRLWQHLANSQVNGVELLREISRIRGHSRQPLMPVVFTSMLGMTLDGLAIDQAMTSLLGDPVHVFTQTPQVWLDHQVMEIDGELVFSWYCMDEVLADKAAQSMFEDFHGVLKAVAMRPELMEQTGLWKLSADQNEPQCFERQGWSAPVADTTIDLRDIEDALLQKEDVLQADVRIDDAGRLRAKVVAAERTYLSADFTGQPLAGVPGLVGLDMAEQTQFDDVWHALEIRALYGIAGTLVRHGLFVHAGQSAGLDEIYQRLRVLPQFERIVRQWLRALTEAGWLSLDAAHLLICQRSLSEMPEAPAAPSSHWGEVLGAYLDRSIERHAELLQGMCSALELFFVDDYAITRALYAENPAAQCVALNVARVVHELAQNTDENLSVLEVGAGTGATTGGVLQALGGRLQTYHFTDVSTFFLDEARKRFAGNDGMAYGIFDINQPVDYSAHPAQGYDLVVAAQVIHDASHIARSLHRIGSLMTPGARLVLIEATHRDSLMQMASVGFIEGLGNYQDLRALDDRAMLDLPQWRGVLQDAGFSVELAWPEHEVSPIHQHVIVARLVHAAHVDCTRLERELAEHFGDTLPSIQVQQSEPLGLFVAEDPAAEKEPTTSAPQAQAALTEGPDAAAGSSFAELLNSVAQVWQSFLGRPVQPQSDFFQSGGDSLIATRVIAQLNRIGIAGAGLQSLFAHPTLEGFCATLEGGKSKGMENVLVPLIQSSSSERVFVFHASDGGVTPSLAFAQALDRNVWGLQAPEQITVKSLLELAEGYLQVMKPQLGNEPYTLIGWSYGATVAAEVARMLHASGKDIRLVLIDPVYGADFAVADLSALMRLLAKEHGIALPDDWNTLDETSRIEVFMSDAVEAKVISQPMPVEIAQQWLSRIHQLLILLSQHHVREAIDVPILWIESDQHPEHWTPAVREWDAWKVRAESHVVSATHWQLMEDAEVSTQVATLVRQWSAQVSREEKNQ